MDMPPRLLRDLLVAARTQSFLPVPQPRQLPAALQVGLHLAREARVEVVLVFRAVRISAAVEFDVRLLVEAHQRQQRLVLLREPPIATLDAPEIPGLDPPLPFVGVTAASPAPQRLPDQMVSLRERARRHLASVIVRPAPYDRVELVDHVFLSGCTHLPQRPANLLQEVL